MVAVWGKQVQSRLSRVVSPASAALRILDIALTTYVEEQSVSKFVQMCVDIEAQLGSRVRICGDVQEVIRIDADIHHLINKSV